MSKSIAMLALAIAFLSSGCSSARDPVTVDIPTVPFSQDIVLEPGDAHTFILPNGKSVAVWCKRNTGIVAAIAQSDIGFEYGEKPFKQLKSEKIQLPDGGTTAGEYLSYIRSGGVYDGGFGNPSEYILYVKQYRISLKETEIGDRGLRMTVSVRLATVKEQVSAKDEVDFYIKRLQSPDPDTQLDAMEELRMLLMLGSMYAKPRWKEIIEAIRPLSASANEEVKSKAVEGLLVLGDEKSIMDVILPEPKGKWRTPEGASSLATYSKHFGKDRIYEKVLPFLESKDAELFRFGMAFFSQVEHQPAKPYMKKALQSEQADVRLRAFQALLDLRGDQRKMARLVNSMLDDKSREVLREALREAGRYNELIPPGQICKHLKHEDEEIRHMAAYALDCCRNPQVIEPLLDATRDEKATVREQAAVSLGRIGAPAAYARLVELLKDPDADVRESAINGLRWFGDPKAIPEIEGLKGNDPDESVRKMARRTIRELSQR
ncbi:MAG: HEAT repeat domain-containing protein [Candidatus Brocadiae bacterium]|nr:HEAT repeat domain-containing protein [Candidatus Brocadiia bacterium]